MRKWISDPAEHKKHPMPHLLILEVNVNSSHATLTNSSSQG